MHKDYSPWISLRIGNDLYIDYPDSIATAETDQGTLLYANESFFNGFCRPWQDLPCVDSIRRDAAKRRLRFTTQDLGAQAIVTVFVDTPKGRIQMVYDIDRDVDVVRSIQFKKGKKVFGELYFDYIQDISTVNSNKFPQPETDIPSQKADKPETLWLSMLAK